mmetsp:Transcript_42499/g.77127  ORF Transcript_42499/g.77127 Transcript_42499/m.77127 type:complete len:87 (-) Transcript_42499:110-370(-)
MAGKATDVRVSLLVAPQDVKEALKALKAAVETGDLKGQSGSDWAWSWDDPDALKAMETLDGLGLLHNKAKDSMEIVRHHQEATAKT